jgi:hypothetical protein
VASGLGFGVDFSAPNLLETLGVQSQASNLGNTLKLEIQEAGQLRVMEVKLSGMASLTGSGAPQKWSSVLSAPKIGKDQFINALTSSEYLCEPLRRFSSPDRTFAQLRPMAVNVVIKLTADFEDDEALSQLQEVMIKEAAQEAKRRDVLGQEKAEAAAKRTEAEKAQAKRDFLADLMKPKEKGGKYGYSRAEAERHMARFDEKKDVIPTKIRDELPVIFMIPEKPYFDDYRQYGSERKLFYGTTTGPGMIDDPAHRTEKMMRDYREKKQKSD